MVELRGGGGKWGFEQSSSLLLLVPYSGFHGRLFFSETVLLLEKVENVNVGDTLILGGTDLYVPGTLHTGRSLANFIRGIEK